jgi:hypothetical protein
MVSRMKKETRRAGWQSCPPGAFFFRFNGGRFIYFPIKVCCSVYDGFTLPTPVSFLRW